MMGDVGRMKSQHIAVGPFGSIGVTQALPVSVDLKLKCIIQGQQPQSCGHTWIFLTI